MTKTCQSLHKPMKTDKLFVLMLVILLPLTGCIDVSDNADAQDADETHEEEMTVINNYYNNTTTVIQPVEPEMVHMYVFTETNSVGTITIGENQTIEWLWGSSIVDTGNGPGASVNPVQITDVSCIDSTAPYYGGTSSGFAIKGEGECTYTLSTNYGGNFVSAHHSLTYLIHEL